MLENMHIFARFRPIICVFRVIMLRLRSFLTYAFYDFYALAEWVKA